MALSVPSPNTVNCGTRAVASVRAAARALFPAVVARSPCHATTAGWLVDVPPRDSHGDQPAAVHERGCIAKSAPTGKISSWFGPALTTSGWLVKFPPSVSKAPDHAFPSHHLCTSWWSAASPNTSMRFFAIETTDGGLTNTPPIPSQPDQVLPSQRL